MKISIDRLFTFSFSLLLLLLINIPTVHKEIKIPILLFLISIIIYKIFFNRLSIHKNIALLFILSMSFGSFFIFNGLLHSNPGAIPSMTVILIWPFLYMLFIGVNGSNNIFIAIDRVLLFSAYFIPLYGLYFLLGKSGGIPAYMFFNIFPEGVMGGVGLYEGSIEVSILNLASVLFIGPYVFSKFLLLKKKKDKLIYFIAIILLLGLVFLSGRRALLIVIVGSFFLIFVLSFFIKNRGVKKQIKKQVIYLIVYSIIAIIALISIILSYYEIDLYKIVEGIVEGLSFGSSQDPSTNARTDQFFSLVNGWSQAPLIGNGFGAIASIIRNTDMPWAYELSYVALLFHTGLIGIIIYFLLILWIVVQGLKITKNLYIAQHIFPYIIGMTSFLIGNMSNPYLMKFDYLWVIFIPIMYINYALLNNKKVNQQ